MKVEICGVTSTRWLQVDISGEDEGIAINYVSREIGFCPENVERISRFMTLKGYITNYEKDKEELIVDIGVFEPKPVNARISLSQLQSQLVDGRPLPLKKITELYGLGEDLPLKIKVNKISAEERIEAELAVEQVLKYNLWIESLLDRLIVLGVTREEAQRALSHTGLWRDVIDVESLGFFEQSLTCKLGTDAVGLISTVGRNLRNAKILSFNPGEIRRDQSSNKT